jgi:cell division septation protein DedD
MKTKVTIKEASELTAKHPDTIRRLIKEHEGTRFVTKRKNKYLIDTDWLLGYFEPIEAPTSPDNSAEDKQPDLKQETATEPFISALVQQLEAKDQQIINLQTLLSEKEANTTKLQDQFQQLLATQQLPAGDNQPQPVTYETPIETEVKTTKPKPKTKKKTTTRKPQGKATTKPVKPSPKPKKWWKRKG